MTDQTSETPRTDARREGLDAGSMDRTPLEGMTDLARTLERALSTATAQLAERDATIERMGGELAAAKARITELEERVWFYRSLARFYYAALDKEPSNEA